MERRKFGLNLEDKKWRYERIRNFIRSKELDAIILGGTAWEEGKIRYITGQYFRIGHGNAHVVFPAEGEPMLFAFTESRLYNFKCVTKYNEDFWFDKNQTDTFENIKNFINGIKLRNKRIGIDLYLIGADIYKGLLQIYPAVDFFDIGADFTALMRIHTENEIGLSRESARICDEVWNSMRTFLKPGLYDYELTAEWSRIMYQNECDRVFNLIDIDKHDVTNVWWPSSHSPRKLENDSLVCMEMSCSRGGYWTQRVGIACMSEPDPITIKLHEAIRDAQLEAAIVIKPGITMSCDVAKKMNEVITGYGFLNSSEFNCPPHGHVMEMSIDMGTLSGTPDNAFLMEESMVFVLHPSAAVKGYTMGKPALFSPGNMYVLTKDGAKPLYEYDIELMVMA